MATDLILNELNNGLRIIKFNRPDKKNAICAEMYSEITNILEEDANNDNVRATILTGVGDYYSSGNDLTSKVMVNQDMNVLFEESNNRIRKFINAFINYPKLLIAVVNGPAIGIAVTSLALCDIVYASDKATFKTPFIDVGLCPEGCSSFLFPRILGRSKASEMLFFGHTMTAQEAYQFRFVSNVIPHNQLSHLFSKLERYGSLSVNSIKRTKQLVTACFKDELMNTSERELSALMDCFHSEEFFEGIQKFMKRKHKL